MKLCARMPRSIGRNAVGRWSALCCHSLGFQLLGILLISLDGDINSMRIQSQYCVRASARKKRILLDRRSEEAEQKIWECGATASKFFYAMNIFRHRINRCGSHTQPTKKMVEKRALHVIAGIRMCVADATAADAVIVHNKIDTVRSMC